MPHIQSTQSTKVPMLMLMVHQVSHQPEVEIVVQIVVHHQQPRKEKRRRQVATMAMAMEMSSRNYSQDLVRSLTKIENNLRVMQVV